MLARKLATVLFVLAFLGSATTAFAQGGAAHEREKSLVERLDDLGKTIFGGILPTEKPKAEAKEAARDIAVPRAQRPYVHKPATTRFSDDVDVPQGIGRRAGSVLTAPEGGVRGPLGVQPPMDDSDFTPENTPPTVPRKTVRQVFQPVPETAAISRAADGAPKRVRRSLADASLLGDGSAVERPSHAPASSRSKSAGKVAVVPATIDSPSQPLHERLAAVRRSAFGPKSDTEPDPQSDVQPVRPSDAPTVQPVDSDIATSEPVARPLVARRVTPDVGVTAPPASQTPLDPEVNAPEADARTPAVVENTPVEGKPEIDDGMLITRKGPALRIETLGPRRISVGKESAYEVHVVNAGEVAAEDMMVFVSLPDWAEVVGTQASAGEAKSNVAGQGTETVVWRLGHLDAKGRERLALRIIPRQSRPFDLAVRWEYKPIASQAAIEVQEPKLAMQLEGPREVLYGKREAYRLRLANVGNGAAEDVSIMMMPIGGGENVPATHKIGMLPAGEEKVLDVELTARQAGNLTIQIDARADGGVRAELCEKVLVRRAGLKVDVEGPKVQFVGTAASYGIRVRNTGNSPACNVNLSITLPAGAKYLSGIEGARLGGSENELQWTVETINPEVEQAFVLKCSLGSAGMSRVQVNASADDDVTATASTTTRVESVANLTMDVKDPEGPVAVGEEATYEVRVRNRGTREAVGVEVYAYFSRGIEPTAAEGCPNRIGTGQVTFQPISLLAPDEEVVLKVRARAEVGGNHIFRAEAHCKPLGTRLISEATNLYYTDSPAAQQVAAEPDEQPGTMRTVTRPVESQLTPVPPRK